MIIDNNSWIRANISLETEERLCTFEVCSDDIIKIIMTFDSKMCHGHDGITIHMIKACASSISKPLVILSKNCFES